jgi:hypothetical protein
MARRRRSHPLSRYGGYSPLAAIEAETRSRLLKGALAIGAAIALYFVLRPKPARASGMVAKTSGGAVTGFNGSTPLAADPRLAAYGPFETYKVQPFDNLTKLARDRFGDESMFAWLFDVNRTNGFVNPNDLSIGQVLILPDKYPAANAAAYAARYAALKACYAAGRCKVPGADVLAFTSIPV